MASENARGQCTASKEEGGWKESLLRLMGAGKETEVKRNVFGHNKTRWAYKSRCTSPHGTGTRPHKEVR